ncbi:hypothetical protein GGR57DRAFT_511838 [Xylariaceae sp. FL1272]|nr:hypothetical protein GGR57DRAFT_511838 [Xylariaceae sp. FL1272]
MSALGKLLSSLPSIRGSSDAPDSLPSHDLGTNDMPLDLPSRRRIGLIGRRRFVSLLHMSPRRILVKVVIFAVVVLAISGASFRFRKNYTRKKRERIYRKEATAYQWESYPKSTGFHNGIRTLVAYKDWIPEQKLSHKTDRNTSIHDLLPYEPEAVNPYPNYNSAEYLEKFHSVQDCYLDEGETQLAPDIYAYPGIPAGMPAPYLGAYELLSIAPDRCYERFGRFGPYGYSYSRDDGGFGLSDPSAYLGAGKVQTMLDKIDYRNVNWGAAQEKCYEKNKARFQPKEDNVQSRTTLNRTAVVLRTWTGYKYTDAQMLTLRAMISELSLKSGGEYDVHLLVHVRDDALPIWADDATYNKVVRENMPEEFQDLATLWSEEQMRVYYPGPFRDEDNVENVMGSEMHGVWRSAHFALQWFAQKHPEYDFFWNWEMDVRYTGHYYELLEGISKWSATQPRKLMWERSAMAWIPEYHGAWSEFSDIIDKRAKQNGMTPIWGAQEFPSGKYRMLSPPDATKPPTSFKKDRYEWGVNETCDLITLDPILDTSTTDWFFRNDISGYDTSIELPPRRNTATTIAGMSRRLLNTMHEETWRMHHTMFSEMWPATIALHHGYKAMYAPHPIYFDRNWPLEVMDQTFNHPQSSPDDSFGWGDNNMWGSTFHYNAKFSSVLWRRWLGAKEPDIGGQREKEDNTGRMCLRPMLLHPIKHDVI